MAFLISPDVSNDWNIVKFNIFIKLFLNTFSICHSVKEGMAFFFNRKAIYLETNLEVFKIEFFSLFLLCLSVGNSKWKTKDRWRDMTNVGHCQAGGMAPDQCQKEANVAGCGRTETNLFSLQTSLMPASKT